MDELGTSIVRFTRALSSDKRLTILQWLSEPTEHFAPQRDGDLVDDGVCLGAIVRKIGLKQPSVTGHMKVLVAAKLVSSKNIKNWVFYKLEEDSIRLALGQLEKALRAHSK